MSDNLDTSECIMENFGKKIRNYADYIIDSKKSEPNPLTNKKVQITGWRNVEIKDGEDIDELNATLGNEYYQQEEEKQQGLSPP